MEWNGSDSSSRSATSGYSVTDGCVRTKRSNRGGEQSRAPEGLQQINNKTGSSRTIDHRLPHVAKKKKNVETTTSNRWRKKVENQQNDTQAKNDHKIKVRLRLLMTPIFSWCNRTTLASISLWWKMKQERSVFIALTGDETPKQVTVILKQQVESAPAMISRAQIKRWSPVVTRGAED